MEQSLSGKVAVVTGAGQGIGRAVAVGLAEAGASVMCAARTESDLAETVSLITGAGGTGDACVTDVTELEPVERLFEETAARLGGVDIVVVNAGGNLGRGSVADGDPGEWAATVELNLTGAYYSARAAVPWLAKQGGGKIIFMGSGMGRRGLPGASAYSASKAGVSMMARVLAQEVWGDGISVNEVIPGPVLTERAQASYASEKDSVFSIDSEWVKTPKDVVPIILFLAGHPDPGPNGQTFSLLKRDM